ncbi:MAG: hypothetical protein Q7R35_02345 [Elusimicrobiota bacterium]|nr:hypothetical protein [Elusimicrobiota bacterium]
MTYNELAAKTAELGFQPAEPGPRNDASKTLAEVVQSHDQRFWEAFPAMLANAAEAGEFDLDAANACLEENERKFLKLLIIVSLGLYESLGMRFAWAEKLSGDLPARLIENFREKFRSDAELELGQVRMLPGKVSGNFLKCFRKRSGSARSAAEASGKLDLELAVSRIFTPRQKELFLKKLRRKKMTKTEKEYFSRVIKKKAQALANEDLHRLARKVLE